MMSKNDDMKATKDMQINFTLQKYKQSFKSPNLRPRMLQDKE